MFRITITEITTVQETQPEWLLLQSGGEYGYVQPPPGKTRQTSRDVLVQSVETIDLAAVIKAINNL